MGSRKVWKMHRPHVSAERQHTQNGSLIGPRVRTAIFLMALPVLLSLASRVHACDPGARVFFVQPHNGATVVGPVRVIFGSELLQVGGPPAAQPDGNVGHYYLFINAASSQAGVATPVSRQHLDFNKGEKETRIDLPPGKYTLTLQFVDEFTSQFMDDKTQPPGTHLSATINLTVVDQLPSRPTF